MKEFLVSLLVGIAITVGCNFLPKAPTLAAKPAAAASTGISSPASPPTGDYNAGY